MTRGLVMWWTALVVCGAGAVYAMGLDRPDYGLGAFVGMCTCSACITSIERNRRP